MQTKLALKFQVATTPALVMASTVLRLPADALDEMIAGELACNPALEARKRPTQHRHAYDARVAGDVADVAETLPARESAIDQLIQQANLLAGDADQKWVACLLHSLDAHGFLQTDLDDLAQALGATQAAMRSALRIVQTLQPIGIGARNVQECLLLQCAALRTASSSGNDMQLGCDHAMLVVQHAWDDFLHHRDARVAPALGISIADVENVRVFMRAHLHPYPMELVQNEADDPVVLAQADMIVRPVAMPSGHTFAIDIPAAGEYALHVNPEIEYMLHQAGADADGIHAMQCERMQQSVEQARRFIDAVHHRWETLQRIGDFLAVHQVAFFEHGPRCLKPLTRAMLADALGLHESTISRAISDKHIELPNGKLMPLDDLFDASLAPKEVIRRLLAQPLPDRAHRPPSDQEIMTRLHEQGFCLSRRTVAKYRQQMGLPSRYRR